MSEYEFDVVHHAGIKHHAADALSHFLRTGEFRTPLEDVLSILPIDVAKNGEGLRIVNGNGEEVVPLNAQSPSTENIPPRKKKVILEQANAK